MKKTLITLLALSGIAMGAQTTIDFAFKKDAQGKIADITFDNISLNQDWKLTLNLTTTVSSGYNNYGTPIVTTNGTDDWQLLQVYAKSADVIIKAENNNDAYKKTLGGDALTAWKATSEKTFVLTYDAAEDTLGLSITDKDKTTILNTSYENINFYDENKKADRVLTQLTTYVTTTMLENDKWTLPSGSFTYGDNVPEPTTATLSLLALAGLAARRRRR